jgi:hypothetical protein
MIWGLLMLFAMLLGCIWLLVILIKSINIDGKE